MRFSLRWLFGLVFYVASGCALLACEYAFLDPLFNIAFAALCLIALTGCIYTRRERRAFWAGFAIVAWSFMLTASLPFNDQTPHGAVRDALQRLSRGHHTGPVSNLRSDGALTFVAIGCSIAGGLLARRFRDGPGE